MTTAQIVWITLVVVTLMLVGAFFAGREFAHGELLAQCKGPERGIHLSVGDKRYFYYCSYVKP